MPKNQKQKFVYLPLGLQADIKEIQENQGLPSFSAALRAISRFGITTIRDMKKMDRDDLFSSYFSRERRDD